MGVEATDVGVQNLAGWLHDELASRRWLTREGRATREAARAIRLTRPALDNILDGAVPKMEGFMRLSEAFDVPAWQLMEMAGFDVGRAEDTTPEAQRARALALKARLPAFDAIIDRLLALPPDDAGAVAAMLTYLESLVPKGRDPDPPPPRQ